MGAAHGAPGDEVAENDLVKDNSSPPGALMSAPLVKLSSNGNDQVRHVGDLGNIAADDNGVADIKIEDRMAKMRSGLGEIRGEYMLNCFIKNNWHMTNCNSPNY